MKTTKAQQQLVTDAQKAGFTIENRATYLDIYKRSKSGAVITKGLRIYEDKTAHRLDVDLGSANTIRTIKDMRSILGV